MRALPRVTLLLTSAALVAVFAPAVAGADEPQDPRCAGAHTLFDPLPDACLEVIDTDRPHQTDTPHTIAAGHTQVESALGEVQLGGFVGEPAPRDRSAHLIFFDDNYKFSPVTGVDVQLLFKHAEYLPGSRTFLPPGPLQARVKVSLVEGKGWVPALTLVPWLFLPVAPSQSLRGGPLLFWGWELPARLELEVNTGVLLGASPKPPAALVLASALTYTVGGEFRVFVDVYATGYDIALGTGALWAFTRDMQIDLGTYIGLSGEEPVATPFLGFSVRR